MATTTRRAPSEASLRYLRTLAAERGLDGVTSAWVESADPDQREVSSRISGLLRLPRAQAALAAEAPAALKPGVYEVSAGKVYVVKPNRARTRLYAKRLVEINGERLNADDDRVRVEFEYAPGAVYRVRPEHQMDVARAKTLTLRYGRCLSCGRTLKAARSVEDGIGPVCIRYFR